MNDFAMPDISWHHVSQDWKQEMCKWSKVTLPIEIALNKTFKKDQNEVQASPTEKVLAERFLGRLRLPANGTRRIAST